MRARLLAVAVALFGVSACGGGRREPSGPVGVTTAPSGPTFAFDSLDERPVTSSAFRGRPAVLCLVTTGNLGSQLQVSYLVKMASAEANRPAGPAFALVVLEPQTNREIAEIYRGKLGVQFPVALAGDDVLAAGGPFGVQEVPTVLVLDREGRVTFQHFGITRPDEIRAALQGL